MLFFFISAMLITRSWPCPPAACSFPPALARASPDAPDAAMRARLMQAGAGTDSGRQVVSAVVIEEINPSCEKYYGMQLWRYE
jgi:hypothetical protein